MGTSRVDRAAGGGDAWEAATRAAAAARIEFVVLSSLGDVGRINLVIERVWGAQELPPELVRAMQHAGCVLIGAVPRDAGAAASGDDDLVGFVLGFAGYADGPHLHSHMLAALPDWQSRGVGFALKLAQRAAALDAGFDDVRWTYDPLLARNAWFNLVKLGAAGTAFLPEFYGEMTDQLNAGDRSDRFEVRWLLASGRSAAAAQGSLPAEAAGGPAVLAVSGDPDAPEPAATSATPEPGSTVAIPTDYLRLRRNDPGLGARWRDASAAAFRACFDAGLQAVAMSKNGVYTFDMVKEPDDHE
jgi:predicted GNAT superfamily acetyltransferase